MAVRECHRKSARRGHPPYLEVTGRVFPLLCCHSDGSTAVFGSHCCNSGPPSQSSPPPRPVCLRGRQQLYATALTPPLDVSRAVMGVSRWLRPCENQKEDCAALAVAAVVRVEALGGSRWSPGPQPIALSSVIQVRALPQCQLLPTASRCFPVDPRFALSVYRSRSVTRIHRCYRTPCLLIQSSSCQADSLPAVVIAQVKQNLPRFILKINFMSPVFQLFYQSSVLQ